MLNINLVVLYCKSSRVLKRALNGEEPLASIDHKKFHNHNLRISIAITSYDKCLIRGTLSLKFWSLKVTFVVKAPTT
jgi:hypothetical protein